MKRAVAVLKMHLTDRLTLFVLPMSVLVIAFAINIVIWLFVPVEGRNTGAACSVPIFVFGIAAYAFTRALPFSLGMGASRRAFLLGTALTGLILSVGFGTLYFALNRIEVDSHGWGLQGHMFALSWFARSAPVMVWLCFMAVFATMFAIGAFLGALWARWRVRVAQVGTPVGAVLAGGVALVITAVHGWGPVIGWFTRTTPASVAAWLVAVIAVSAAASWAVLRRYRVG